MKPRSLSWGTALLILTLIAPAASAAGALAAAKPAPVPGGQVVTTTENDTNGDGVVDQRSIFTTSFDSKGRVFVRNAEEYDTDVDGTVDASRVLTTEYDKSGSVVRQVDVSNINDLGSGGDGSVFERATITTAYDAKNHPVLQVVELDRDSNGTLELRQRTAYVNDERGNALGTVFETSDGRARVRQG